VTNRDAFEIRVQLHRTIAPRPPASVLPHDQAAYLGIYKRCRPGGQPPPAMAPKVFYLYLNPHGWRFLASGPASGLRSVKTCLVSCCKHRWTTKCLLWGITRPVIRWFFVKQRWCDFTSNRQNQADRSKQPRRKGTTRAAIPSGQRQARPKSMKPRWTSVWMSLTRTWSPTLSP